MLFKKEMPKPVIRTGWRNGGGHTVPAGPPVPQPPTNLAAEAGDGEVDLTWDAATYAVVYSVYRSEASGTGYVQVGTSTTESFADTTAVNDTEYFYVVVAKGQGPQVSGYSNEATAMPTGSSPVLLTDLVAGWALTAGPEQTLSSDGVVASGPLDFTENGGPLSYGANGVSLNGVDQFLTKTNTAALQAGDTPFFWLCEAISLSLDDGKYDTLIDKAVSPYNSAFEYVLAVPPLDDPFIPGQPDALLGPPDYAEATSATAVSTGTRYIVGMAYDKTNEMFGVLKNGVWAWVSSPNASDTNTGPLCIGFTSPGDMSGARPMPGSIRRVRFWKGANAETIVSSATYIAWLYNSGNGRTDAEVAAYTG